jgi:hypothetical protein
MTQSERTAEQPIGAANGEGLDTQSGEAYRSAAVLIDSLLERKDPDAKVAFVDIVVDNIEAAAEMIADSSVGRRLLTGPDDQLVLPPNSEYYPALSVPRRELTMKDISVRAWGWNAQPIGTYPESESNVARRLDIRMEYSHPTAGYVGEDLILWVIGGDSIELYSRYFIDIYKHVDIDYDGHKGKEITLTDEVLAEFLELVARIVGDEPVSSQERNRQRLSHLVESTRGEAYNALITQLIDVCGPVQAPYELYKRTTHDQLWGCPIVEALAEGGEPGRIATEAMRAVIQQFQKGDPVGLDPLLWGPAKSNNY